MVSERTSARRKTVDALKEEFTTRTRTKKTEAPAPETEATPETNIKSNTFYKVLFDKNTSAEEKKSAIEKILTFEGTKAENAQRVAEFEAFKQYLQLQRQTMAKKFMELADTESFSELKRVIDEMNDGLIDFEERMKPLSDILDAVYQLRTGGDGLIFDAYKDIEQDKRAEAERQSKLEKANKAIKDLGDLIEGKQADILKYRDQKTWFGWGGIKPEAKDNINKTTVRIGNLQKQVEAETKKLQDIKTGKDNRSSLLPPEFADAKAKLRDLLDISSEEHSERQAGLIDAAKTFVTHAQTRTKAVLGHLEGMDVRMENIGDANRTLGMLYAIMDDASKEAAKTNKGKSDTLAAEKGKSGLSSIASMELDDKITAINDHITNLDRTAVDTSKTLADLSEQGGRILTMKDRNKSQIAKTRAQMTSGIGGVADRLVGVLSAVSLASLSESSELMQGSLNEMDKRTRASTEQEVFQKVLGQKLQNDELSKALEEASKFREVLGKGTDLYKDQVRETHSLVDQMSAEAAELREIVDIAKGAHADAYGEAKKIAGDAPVANDNAPEEIDNNIANPFDRFAPQNG